MELQSLEIGLITMKRHEEEKKKEERRKCAIKKDNQKISLDVYL